MKKGYILLAVLFLAGCASMGAKSANDYLAESDMYYRKGNLKAAWDSAQNALKADPNAVSAYGTMGAVLYEQGNYDEAIKYFELLYKAGDKRSEIISALAASYAAKGDYNKALNYVNEALKVNPSNVAALTTLGGIYYSKKEYQKAVDTYTKALKILPSAAVYSQRAGAYAELGREDLAMKDYKAAGIEVALTDAGEGK